MVFPPSLRVCYITRAWLFPFVHRGTYHVSRVIFNILCMNLGISRIIYNGKKIALNVLPARVL